MNCPFCNETDFDKIGLKYHLLNYCVEYKNTPDANNPCYQCEYRKPDEREYINICLLDESQGCIRSEYETMTNDTVYYKCTYCGYVLTDDQYKDAVFNRCPRCTRHLSMWKKTNDMIIIRVVPSVTPRLPVLPFKNVTQLRNSTRHNSYSANQIHA